MHLPQVHQMMKEFQLHKLFVHHLEDTDQTPQ